MTSHIDIRLAVLAKQIAAARQVPPALRYREFEECDHSPPDEEDEGEEEDIRAGLICADSTRPSGIYTVEHQNGAQYELWWDAPHRVWLARGRICYSPQNEAAGQEWTVIG